VFGPLSIVRTAEAVLIVGIILVTRSDWRPPRTLVLPLVGIGVLDMVGNGAYILAVQSGALAVASVVSSLYPVTTVILATVFLRERVTRSHAAGIALAALAIVLIGVGSS
jgi:drug/metabolite transporter (DMT)-like permease